MKAPLKSFFFVIQLIPVLAFGQTYRTDLQMDLTHSGEKKIGHEKGTLIYSKDKGEFSVKFDNLQSTETYKISYIDKRDNGDHMQTMYEIVGDLNYGGFKVAEYKSPIKIGDSSYPVSFTIIGMNEYGGIAYYTTFYAKKK
jgi:hypothetical protein